MAMVSMNSLLNGKDSRWLQLEVCREFQRNKCSRSDTECKFAHPPANVEVQNGRVTACYDSIKGRCNREKPPCKYFHPPQHLKDQLLINGRNHLALKNALMQQMGLAPGQVLQTQLPAVASNPFMAGVPGVGSGYSPYFAAGPLVPAALVGHDPGAVPSPLAPALQPQPLLPPQKLPRSDRLEMDMKTVGSFYYDNFAFPGMMPYKRAAADKSGVPVYQPATTYQQLMQLQQPFVPVSCEYPAPAPPSAASPRPPAPPAAVPARASPPAPAPASTAPPSASAAAPAPAPATAADPAQVAKEVAHSNYAAKLAQQAQAQAQAQQHAQQLAQQQAQQVQQVQQAALATSVPSVSSVGAPSMAALSYTGVALNKQVAAPLLRPSAPQVLYRPPNFAPNLLRAQLQSQIQNQIQSQLQLQNYRMAQSIQGQLQSQLQDQLQNQLQGQLQAQLQSQFSAHLNGLAAGGLQAHAPPPSQPPPQLPVQWATAPPSLSLPLSQHLMSHNPSLYSQQLLYQLPPTPVPTSTPSVIMNPYKKMKTT